LKGKTPLELQLAFGTAISYKVVASEALESESGFAPFEAVFAATEDTDLSIWLDRLD